MNGDCKNGTEVIGLELDILGKKVNFCINAGQNQARLSDIVPLARTLCTKITDIVLENATSNGDQIACHKGCLACCRHLIPLSVPEAFRLKEEIEAQTADRHELMWKTCIHAAHQILNQKPPAEFMSKTEENSQAGCVDLNLVSQWYSSLHLDCPFLHSGVCAIYEQRPLVCREHYIIGSEKACREGGDVAKVLEMPVQMTTALGRLAGELEVTSVEAVLLPLALVWCEENHQRSEQTWPFEMMVRRFFEIVKEMACENAEIF
ncbi:MAG: hypothetical protein A2173_05245 [Planctomycetes bacterium RBG_13_44_8b]|nr:MAG: hypothetical protein A2173_05245 [Planctomycetes bacterium RBG_13_44_8b]